MTDSTIESTKQRRIRPWPWPSFTIHNLNRNDVKYFISLMNPPEDSTLYKNIEEIRHKLLSYNDDIDIDDACSHSPRFGSEYDSPQQGSTNTDLAALSTSSTRISRLCSEDDVESAVYNLSDRSASIPIQPQKFADLVNTSITNPSPSNGSAWKERYFGGDIKAFRKHQWTRLKERGASPRSDMKIRVVNQQFQTGYHELQDDQIVEGMVIDKYKIQSHIGKGAHSIAFSAQSIPDGKPVCLKMSLSNNESTCLIIAEINTLSVLNTQQDSLIQTFDYFFYRGRFFLVTELLGSNLHDYHTKPNIINHSCILINNRNVHEKIISFSFIGIAIIAKSLLSSLIKLDKLGLFHGDIKPENILTNCYNGKCDVKLIDFGSSLYICENVNNYQQTRPYRSPEMVLGLPYDTKADLWSVGALLAELWSGKMLFPSYNNASLLSSIISLLGPIPQYLLNASNTFNSNSSFFISDKYIVDLDESLEGTLIVPERSCLLTLLRTTKPCDCDYTGVEVFHDFLIQLLKLDPSLRPDPLEALRHPFLKTPSNQF